MCEAGKFQRFILRYAESNMYLCIEGKEALIVDPNKSDEALSMLQSNGVDKLFILLTHEHFDHTSGVNWYKKKFETKVICQRNCAEWIGIAKNNRPFVFMPTVEDKNEHEKREVISFFDALPMEAIKADVVYEDEYEFDWAGHNVKLCASPGHSPGSSIILFDDTYVFTGDYMIPNVPVILRFAGGSKEAYRQDTLPFLLGLGGNMMVMPGHRVPCLYSELVYEHGIFMKN